MLTVDFDTLAVKEGQIALDAGCGEGRHSFEFIRRGAHVFSMDLDMDSLLKARYTLAHMKRSGQSEQETGYCVHVGNANTLPFKNETFDRIICSEVMEHVPDDEGALQEFIRVLKKDGLIAVTVPTIFSEVIYDALTYEYFTSPGGHIRKYLPKELVAMMRKNGLEVYSIGFKHSFHTIWWIIRCVVGLHLNNHPITKSYHRFLHLGLFSKFMRRCERFFDFFFPKSIVIYGWKR